jgi:cytochrome P450
MARKVVKDVEVAGCPMHAGEQVLLTFPAANHDPAAFERPDEFLIDREHNRHVAFGVGIHRCLGSNLARLELTIALQEWLRAFPHYRLDPGQPITWNSGQVRGPRNIPVFFGTA